MDSPLKFETRLPEAALRRVQVLAASRLGMENRPGKEILLHVRASRHMRELGVTDASEYLRLLEGDASGTRIQELLDLLTTNHTAFWREPGHFEWLGERLAALGPEETRLTVWCAAASSGEEPYTLAMVAREAMGPAAHASLRILATDVSTRMLASAREGVYCRQRLQPLPEAWRRQYFEAAGDGRKELQRVKEEIRQMVHFRWLNLIDPLPAMGPFPYIFCRNVMIYFSPETRMRIVQNLLQRLTPDGYLLVGSAEGLSGLESYLEYVRPAVYRRRPQGGERWV